MLKTLSWNLENAYKLLTNNPDQNNLNRRNRILDTLLEINPDIICVVEGPKGEQDILDFCVQTLQNLWQPVLLDPAVAPGMNDSLYKISGNQWMWFLVKPGLMNNCRLQAPSVWQTFTGQKTWSVHKWGEIVTTAHNHYRHPQVMIYKIDNEHDIEFIGVHLKSKINQKPITRDAQGNLTGDYLKEALEARVKLTTEARDIRRYIDAKFNQLPAPAIMLMGDCNDGPGLDLFEDQYLYFDLITNLQGEVLVAEKFFNHALFDYTQDLRWSYKCSVLNASGTAKVTRQLLIDHILFSQALVRSELNFPMIINPAAGKVEHQAYDRHNAGSNSKTRTSDHRPVSCIISDN